VLGLPTAKSSLKEDFCYTKDYLMQLLSISFYRRYRLQLAIFGLLLSAPWALPQLPAAAATNSSLTPADIVSLTVPFWVQDSPEPLYFPGSAPRTARYVIKLPVTAYSSTPDQTDGSPFITASGTSVRWGVVAANFLPIGTLVRLPDYYGDQIFVVEDRMNARYNVHLDIWMQTRQDARQWGVKYANLEVL
jgi:3D (Asp-Asp-Asp) domain-containing protein